MNFSLDKLYLSLYESLKHRRSAIEDASALTTTITGKLSSKYSSPKIPKQELIDLVAGVLKRFNKPAHVYYIAYYANN